MKKYILMTVGSIMLASMLGACTDYDTPPSIAEDPAIDSISSSLSRRVLWINIDGGRASAVKQAVEQGSMPNVQQMLEHSKYSWSGLSDTRSGVQSSETVSQEDPVTWASMLTGVNSNLHKINDYSYTPNFSFDKGGVGTEVSYFPTMVQYLGNLDGDVSISVVTPWENLNRYLGDAHSVTTTQSDENTFETVSAQLKSEDFRFHIVSFKDALEAGKSGGFSVANSDYISALSRIDGYIGSLLSDINARENAPYEDWLVVITSNVGGDDQGHTAGISDAERDIFGLFYYNHYTTHEMKGETLSAVLFNNHGVFYAFSPDSTGVYSIGDGQYAIELTFQNLPLTNGSYKAGNWTKIIGKSSFGIYRQREDTKIYFQTKKYGANVDIEEGTKSANDMRWHHYYYAFDKNEREGRAYQLGYDGVTNRITFTEGANTTLPLDDAYLNVGVGNDAMTDYRISTIRLWNAILPDVEVTRNASNGHYIAKDSPIYNNLIGEWVLSPERYVAEEDSIVVKKDLNDKQPSGFLVCGHIDNSIAGAPALYFTKPPTFEKVPNTLPDFIANGNLMMENTMVAPQILYWFCGLEGVDSKLCGYPFLKNYAIEEQWRDNGSEE